MGAVFLQGKNAMVFLLFAHYCILSNIFFRPEVTFFSLLRLGVIGRSSRRRWLLHILGLLLVIDCIVWYRSIPAHMEKRNLQLTHPFEIVK